jgi:hypothetical protein
VDGFVVNEYFMHGAQNEKGEYVKKNRDASIKRDSMNFKEGSTFSFQPDTIKDIIYYKHLSLLQREMQWFAVFMSMLQAMSLKISMLQKTEKEIPGSSYVPRQQIQRLHQQNVQESKAMAAAMKTHRENQEKIARERAQAKARVEEENKLLDDNAVDTGPLKLDWVSLVVIAASVDIINKSFSIYDFNNHTMLKECVRTSSLLAPSLSDKFLFPQGGMNACSELSADVKNTGLLSVDYMGGYVRGEEMKILQVSEG